MVSPAPSDSVALEGFDKWDAFNGAPLSPVGLDLPTLEELGPAQEQWLLAIYEGSWETIFGSWMSGHSCPFLFRQRDASQIPVSISQLSRQLDGWMNEGDDGLPTDTTIADWDIEQSLTFTIQAFAARWLPLVAPGLNDPDSVIRSLWRRARRDMLRVINRPSYRSMLTLLLFGLTPVPTGISEEEEMDGISGQGRTMQLSLCGSARVGETITDKQAVCVQSALHQVQALRARQKVLRFNGSKVSPQVPIKGFSPKEESAASKFITTENTVYWAAITFDTSASLTLGARPMLTSGLFGHDLESSWRLVKVCRHIFHDATVDWREGEFEWTDLKANQVIAAASTGKLLAWKTTAIFKEAISDGHDDNEVMRAFTAFTECVDNFNTTYRDLLTSCQKRIHFFNQETKLRWYVLMLHYHLAILLLVDMVEAAERFDLLPRTVAIRNEAESSVLTCLDFGLNTTFNLALPAPSNNELSYTQSITTVPLTSIDPYPHHVVAAVQLLRKAVYRDYASDKISADVHQSLLSTLTRALEHLPSSSKSVQAAREDDVSSRML